MRLTFVVIIWGCLCWQVMAQDDCSTNGLMVDCKTTPNSQYNSFRTRTICQLSEFYENSPVIATNIYGSRTDKKTSATGFFYSKFIADRWWIVDPEGYLNICRAVNAISQGTGQSSKSAFTTKFGTTNAWMDQTKKLLNDNGFYCAGAWSTTSSIAQHPNQTNKPLAYTIILNWMSGYGANRTYQQSGHAGYPNDCIFVFEKGFADYCETKAMTLLANLSDKNLFGYFTDNELPFYNRSLNNFLRLGKTSLTDENYLATKKWLMDNNFTAADTLNPDVQARFLGFVGETYFSIVYNAIKKVDPNHMVIGPRVNIAEARDNKYFMQSAGKFVDILSVNYYSVWTPVSSNMSNWGENLGKPFMVTEFYTKGEDAGLANTSGAGWIVKTQLDRGYAYQNYTLALLESKYCVGWHWFKYFDNDPSIPDPEPSNVDANKGIVNILYEPYVPLLNKMKDLNLRVYSLIDYFDQKKAPVVIYPEADAYYKGSLNFGSDDRLGIKKATDQNAREAFLRFDLSRQSKQVTDVNLCLSVVRSGDVGMTYLAEFVTDDSWTESGITVEQHPVGTYEIGRWKHGSNVVLDVKKSYLETLDSDKKLSIKLSAMEPVTSQLEYASRENTTVSLRPRIEISSREDAPANVAQLSEIVIDDRRFSAFHPDTLSYSVVLPQNTSGNPKVVYYVSNQAMKVEMTVPVNVQSTLKSDRTATIRTTSADGSKQLIYTITFQVNNPVTSSDEILAEYHHPELSVYPNPVSCSSRITLKFEHWQIGSNLLFISDLSGKSVYRTVVIDAIPSLELNGILMPGIYIVSIRNSKGLYSKKIIVN